MKVPIKQSAPRWGLIAIFLWGIALAIQGLGVAPPRFELLASPGENITKEVVVFSQDAGHQIIDPALVDWTIDPNGKLIVLNKTTKATSEIQRPYSAIKWLKISFDPFDLNPDEPVTVKFSIDVPNDPGLNGSYWAAIAFTNKPKPATYNGLSVLVNTRVLSIVYVTIQGTERPASELQGVSIEAGDDGKQYVVADVVNKGNVYLRLNGELRFLNTKGEVVKRLPLPERVLLRDGLVRYRLPLPDDLPDDALLAAIEIQPQGPAKSYGGPPLYGETSLK